MAAMWAQSSLLHGLSLSLPICRHKPRLKDASHVDAFYDILEIIPRFCLQFIVNHQIVPAICGGFFKIAEID